MRYEVFANPDAGPLPEPPGGPDDARLAFHRGLPGHAPTPLRECPGLARRLGMDAVLVKDEATRFGLPSFTILGASWASVRTVLRHWVDGPVRPLTLAAAAVLR